MSLLLAFALLAPGQDIPCGAASRPQDCRFPDVLALWHAEGNPSDRVDRALRRCGEYPSQVLTNFCSVTLEEAVRHDLDRKIAQLRLTFKSQDRDELRDCEKYGSPCGIAGHNVEMLDAFHTAWLAYVEARCAYQTRDNQGGTGYASYNTRCWLRSAVDHMAQLEKSYE